MLYGVEACDTLSTDVPSGPPPIGSAVNFNAACLFCSSLTASDSSFFSFSHWMKDDIGNPTVGLLWIVDGGNAGTNFVPTIQSNAANQIRIITGGGGAQWRKNYTTTSGWHHYLGSVETNQASGARKMILYIDDVLATATTTTDTGSAFLNEFSGLSFAFGDGAPFPDGTSPIGTDVADVWIAPGVQLHSGTTIPEATRRQFTDFVTGTGCVPIDTSTYPTSAILFTGDATTFPNNQGTGGTFTVTGSITNASTHP